MFECKQCVILAVIFVFMFWVLPQPAMAQACSIGSLRTGSQPGDSFIGPTCNSDGTYRTCIYAEGANHPVDGSQYALSFDGLPFPVVFDTRVNSGTSVLCADNLPSAVGLVDVAATLEPGCNLLAQDLYNAPDCLCSVNSIRLGGQTGDLYVGPTCNGDGTFRTCFYAEGAFHPSTGTQYSLKLDNVPTTIAYSTRPSSNTTIICADNLAGPAGPFDIYIELQPSCSGLNPNLLAGLVCPNLSSVCVPGPLNLTAADTGSAGSYKSENVITAGGGFTVQVHDVQFAARTGINLDAGFRVETGVLFNALADPAVSCVP